MLIDDALLRVRGEQKWELLDLVERVADKTQIVYLTDDHDVVVWARRRAGASTERLGGSVALRSASTEP